MIAWLRQGMHFVAVWRSKWTTKVVQATCNAPEMRPEKTHCLKRINHKTWSDSCGRISAAWASHNIRLSWHNKHARNAVGFRLCTMAWHGTLMLRCIQPRSLLVVLSLVCLHLFGYPSSTASSWSQSITQKLRQIKHSVLPLLQVADFHRTLLYGGWAGTMLLQQDVSDRGVWSKTISLAQV